MASASLTTVSTGSTVTRVSGTVGNPTPATGDDRMSRSATAALKMDPTHAQMVSMVDGARSLDMALTSVWSSDGRSALRGLDPMQGNTCRLK
jgi:hypothetical protein